MSGSHPPSTNGSPRLGRRALTTTLAALGAVVAPVALVAVTAGSPAGSQAQAEQTSTSFAPDAYQLVRSQADTDAVAFRDVADTSTTTTVAPTTTTTAAPTTTTTSPPPPPTTAPPAPAPAPAPPPPPPPPAPVAAPSSAPGDPNNPASWDRLAQCESGGNWAINTGNGYYGGLQFSLSSWRGVGGPGYPHEQSRETQIEMGKRLHAQGGWKHWPACTRSFGWR